MIVERGGPNGSGPWVPAGPCAGRPEHNGAPYRARTEPPDKHDPERLDNTEAAIVLTTRREVEDLLVRKTPELHLACRGVIEDYHAATRRLAALWAYDSDTRADRRRVAALDHSAAESALSSDRGGEGGSVTPGMDSVSEQELRLAVGRAWEARRRAQDRHVDDGPVSRLSKPKAIPLLAWISILIAAIFDTWYFAAVFRYLGQVRDDGLGYQQVISYLPGFLLAMALLAAGTMIAKPIRLWQLRVERRSLRPAVGLRTAAHRLLHWRKEGRREPDGLPWPIWGLPVAFLGFVLGIVLLWAYIRAVGEGVPSDYPPLAVALLLVVLTVTAVVMKVMAYNPYLEEDLRTRRAVRAAERRLSWSERRSAWRVRRWAARARHNDRVGRRRWESEVATAGRAIATHAISSDRLRSVLLATVAEARTLALDGWVHILRQRATHGLAGDLPPSIAVERASSGIADDTDLPVLDPAFAVFDRIPEPALDLSVLHHGRRVLVDYGPARLRNHWERIWQRPS